MSGEVVPESRSAVMIVVDAWWEGREGALQTARACIVNKSISGACIRVKMRIGVGAQVRIQSRWEEFCGVAKYCRSEGNEYLVGIHRETGESTIPKQRAAEVAKPVATIVDAPLAALAEEPCNRRVRSNEVLAAEARIESLARRKPQERERSQISAVTRKVEGAATVEAAIAETANAGAAVAETPSVEAAGVASEMPARKVMRGSSRRRRRDGSRYLGLVAPRWLESRATPLLEEQESEKKMERLPMERNWMGMEKRGNAAEAANENGVASGESGGERSRGAREVAAPAAEKARAGAAAESDARYQTELLPLEDIYLAAGIVNPRRGYTINKVVEMLHSEHLGGLSKELRRASVMMALDAAGIPIDEVLRDAKARLAAMDAYEAEQRKLCESEWARKAEEHVQIQVELEQIKNRFLERLKQNVDGVARDRARFESWLTIKQQETQSITEAAELCLKAAAPEKASEPEKVAAPAARGVERGVKVV